MKGIFLSLLNIAEANEVKFQEYIEYFTNKHYSDDNPLYWLFKDKKGSLSQFYNIELQKKSVLNPSHIPVFDEAHSDIVLKLLGKSNLSLNDMDVLCYCHETIEDSHSILPVLKTKKKLGLKNSFPFSVGHAGSLNSAMAIELATSLLKGSYENFLLTIVDSILPPFSRFSFNGYIKGDGAVSILLSKNQGNYKIKDVQIYPSCLNVNLSRWGVEEYLKSEDLIVAKYKDLLDYINSSENSIKFVLHQNLSDRLHCKFEEVGCNLPWDALKRIKYPHINLLGSDIFYSLKEIEEHRVLISGDEILLVSTSIDHGIAGIVLEKT